MKEYIKFYTLSKDEEIMKFLAELYVNTNKTFEENENDPYFVKLHDLYLNGRVKDFLTFLMDNHRYFGAKNIQFILYASLGVALNEGLIGVYHNMLNLFNQLLNDGEGKTKVLANFNKLLRDCIKLKGTEQTQNALNYEFDQIKDANNIVNAMFELAADKTISLEIVENIISKIFTDPDLNMQVKAISLVMLQRLYDLNPEHKRTSLTLVYGKDEDNNPVTWYENVDLNKVTNFSRYNITASFEGLKEFDAEMKNYFVNFFVYEYTLRLDDYFLVPITSEQTIDDSNIKLFTATFVFINNKLSDLMPFKFKKVNDMALPEGYEEILTEDFNNFVNDKSIFILKEPKAEATKTEE